MRKPNKFWIHLACCFIPSRRLRHKLRRVEKHFEFIGKNNRVFIGDVEVFNPVRGIAINIIAGNPAQIIKTGVDWSPINPYALNKIQKGKSNE